MDNENEHIGNSNWTPPVPPQMGNQDLPDATLSLTLGIIGLVLSIFVGCGIVGFFFSIFAFTKGRAAEREFQASPGMYTDSSHTLAKIGKILGLIGIIFGGLGILLILVIIVMVIVGAAAG